MAVTKRKKLSRGKRLAVYRRDDWTCRYCGRIFDGNKTWTPESVAPYLDDDRLGAVFLEIDHIHPLFLGGSNEVENLCAACTRCNRQKSFRALEAVI